MAVSSSNTTDFPPTTIEVVATQLERDMRQRGLRAGDRYLTAAEAAKAFSISPMTANRAMQILAKRQFLVRQRSRGTFVGPKFENGNEVTSAIDVVHIFMAMDYHQTQGVSTDSLVDGFMRFLPGAVVDIQFIPERNSFAYVERAVRRMGQGDETEGVVLIRGSQHVQQCVQESSIPAVVYGQVYPGVELSCLKHDQTAVGRLIAEYAIRGGYRRCVLLTRSEWRHGDNKMLDAVTQTLAAAELPLDGLLVRSVPTERAVVRETAQSALESTGEPTVFLCRNDFFAEAAIEAGNAAGRRLGVDFDVVSGGHTSSNGACRFGRILSVLSLSEQMKELARLLIDAAKGDDGLPQIVTAPVEFQEPERTLGAIGEMQNGESHNGDRE